MSGRYCYLCGKRQPRRGTSTFTLHKFPTDLETCSKWKEFCNFVDMDYVSANLRLCSGHFTPESYIDYNSKKFGGILQLKPTAVPSIWKDRKHAKITEEYLNAPSINIKKESETLSISNASCSSSGNLDLLPPASENVILTDVSRTATTIAEHSDFTLRDAIVQTDLTMLNIKNIVTFEEHSETPLSPIDIIQEESGRTTPKRPRYAELRYISDIKLPHFSTPRRAKIAFTVTKQAFSKQKKRIRQLYEANRRLKKKIVTLNDLIHHLKEKKFLHDESAENIQEAVPETMKLLIERQLQRKAKYTPKLRSFALTLSFYSPKAYNYIRKIWRNLLPHPAIIRKWYTVLECSPGFTQEAFDAIKRRTQEQNVICNVVTDEMAIKKQFLYEKQRFYGGVDLGTGLALKENSGITAKNALVFLAVALTGKVALGYFLIRSLSGQERANLMLKCLELLHQTGAKVYSITFDGASSNIRMCTELGATLQYNNLKPWFINPMTQEKIFIFYDPCHMIKLIRNTLGDKKVLLDNNNTKIKWSFLQDLLLLQAEEGLHVANKLSKKHINFNDNRMKVKLATQVLSQSVADSLKFVKSLGLKNFEDCDSTVTFCLNFNFMFDMLNVRNKFSRKNEYCVPINEENFENLRAKADLFITYIELLKDEHGTPILQTNRKTGFLGMIICLKNIFELYLTMHDNQAEYLLTYKLSQDFIETFFSAIRARGGFNNNPNARQFESAYKPLLLRHELKEFDNSNCLADGIEILTVSSMRKQSQETVMDNNEINSTNIFEHDYISTMRKLTPFVENAVEYIGGFIVYHLMKKAFCEVCKQHLLFNNTIPTLIKIKNRGKLITPSKDVLNICKNAEKIIRENYTLLFEVKNIFKILSFKIFNRVYTNAFNSEIMQEHILSQDPVDNHKSQLTKLIFEKYLSVRLFHDAKEKSKKDEYIRHKYTKLIHFKNQ